MNATDTFECLVDVDAVDLQAANVAIGLSGFFGTFTAVPVIDGKFITGSPSRQIESGRLNGVSVMHQLLSLYSFYIVRRNAFSQSRTLSKGRSSLTRHSQLR